MKFFKSKFFIITLIVAIVLTLIPTLIAAFGGTDLLRTVLGTVAKPFTFCASGVANAVDGFVDVFTRYDNLKEENESLKKELDKYKDKEYNEDVLKDHLDWLEDYLNIHNLNPNLVKTDAKVIGRESSNTSTTLSLNKGAIHGIKNGMPVITAEGLVGYVSETGADYCKVSAVIKPSQAAVGVYSERSGGILGFISGTTELHEQGLCKMTLVDGESNLQIGDRLLTAGGKNSIYPSGLPVGTVSEISIDDATGKMQATVTPFVDFSALSELRNVLIITAQKENA